MAPVSGTKFGSTAISTTRFGTPSHCLDLVSLCLISVEWHLGYRIWLISRVGPSESPQMCSTPPHTHSAKK